MKGRSAIVLVALALLLALQHSQARKLSSNLNRANSVLRRSRIVPGRALKAEDYDYAEEKGVASKSPTKVTAAKVDDYDYEAPKEQPAKATVGKKATVTADKNTEEMDYAGLNAGLEEEEEETTTEKERIASQEEEGDFDYSEQPDTPPKKPTKGKITAKTQTKDVSSKDYDYDYSAEEPNSNDEDVGANAETSPQKEKTPATKIEQPKTKSNSATDYDYDYEDESGTGSTPAASSKQPATNDATSVVEKEQNQQQHTEETEIDVVGTQPNEVMTTQQPTPIEEESEELKMPSGDQGDHQEAEKVETESARVEEGTPLTLDTTQTSTTPNEHVMSDVVEIPPVVITNQPVPTSAADDLADVIETGSDGELVHVSSMQPYDGDDRFEAALGFSTGTLTIIGVAVAIVGGAFYYVRSSRARGGLDAMSKPRYMPVVSSDVRNTSNISSGGGGADAKGWSTDDSNWEDVKPDKARDKW